MFRLNDKAEKILKDEVQKCSALDPVLGTSCQKIVLDRLILLKDKIGKKATEEELRMLIKDLYPNFSDEILKKAALANNPSLFRPLFTVAIFLTLGSAGLIWLVNLPYPMLRRPVARVAPILLLPSYLSMDKNYREAIANVEQADQLIIKATSAADIKLGEEKVIIAKQNLEALPVWFLGYEPARYCSMMSCNWQFTFDEFESARKQIGRMEAIIFQEKNALTQLEKAENAIIQAKQNYQNPGNSEMQATAITQWQNSLNELNQIPSETWAGKSIQTKLANYKGEFEKVTGVIGQFQRTNNLIQAAKEFGKNAVSLTENPPHEVAIWEQSQNLWQQAIEYLNKVSVEDSGYLEAQKLLATYKTNLARIEIRKQAEIESVEALKYAESQINELLANRDTNNNSIIVELQKIINELEKVQTGTTGYQKSQELLKSAQNKLKEFEKAK